MSSSSSRGPARTAASSRTSRPGAAVSSTPGWQAGSRSPGTYTLPAGTDVQRHLDGLTEGCRRCGAADQRGQADGAQSQPEQLRQAINSSARFIPGCRCARAGQRPHAGRCRLEPGEDQHQDGRDDQHRSSEHGHQRLLATPDQGTGIYEREGWSAGQSATRTITLSGGNGTYTLGWKGNDGTFSTSVRSVRLNGNASAAVPVTVHPPPLGFTARSSTWTIQARSESTTR